MHTLTYISLGHYREVSFLPLFPREVLVGNQSSFLCMETFFYLFPIAAAKSLQSCPTLCDPIDSSPPGSPVPSPVMKVKNESEVAQSFPTLSDPMDCSLPGSSVRGIFQARVLEWGAIAFSSLKLLLLLLSRFSRVQLCVTP